MNFLKCKINPRDKNFLVNINAHPGYYLLRIEEDFEKNYGNINGPIHKTRYSLMHVFQGASSLMATADGVFIWSLIGIITGYYDIGLDDEITKICK